ncbi:MAG: hypothetical protein RBS51_05455 [Anaerovoracaceae bacterium]|nr:hypothetical protein [Anaerovoracaceae bacterium]
MPVDLGSFVKESIGLCKGNPGGFAKESLGLCKRKPGGFARCNLAVDPGSFANGTMRKYIL